MLGSILTQDRKFFDLFNAIGDLIVEAATEFRAMLQDLSHAEKHARQIKDLEHKADEVTHRTVELLHKTFITPLDREDIHQLISRLDDVIDFIDAAASRLHLYEITESNDIFKALGETVLQAALVIQKIVRELPNVSKQGASIVKSCVEINRLENDADHALRSGVAKLFKEEQDIRQLIKLKEVYELLETVTDRCEDVANIIESIVVEYG